MVNGRQTNRNSSQFRSISRLNTEHGIRNTLFLLFVLVALAPQAMAQLAMGGTVTNYRDLLAGRRWTVQVFTNVGNTNITFKSGGLVEYLVVVGGSGAGGMLTGTVAVAAQPYTITVGGGGNGSGGAGAAPTAGGGAGQAGVAGGAGGLPVSSIITGTAVEYAR